jgi:hypothetical protein
MYGNYNALPIKDNRGRTIAAKVDGTLFVEKCKVSHLYRKYDAWAINAHVFFDHPEIEKIIITEYEHGTPTGLTYTVNAEYFKHNAHVINFKGHAMQYALPRKEWEVTKK